MDNQLEVVNRSPEPRSSMIGNEKPGRPPDNKKPAEVPPIQFDEQLNPPTRFKAGSEGWTLVSRSPNAQGDLVLARINSDDTVDYKAYPEEAFCKENNISAQAITCRMGWRYHNPNAEGEATNYWWSYGGVVRGYVIVFRSIVDPTAPTDEPPRIEFTRLAIEQFQQERQERGLTHVIEGQRNPDYRPPPMTPVVREFYIPHNTPLMENIARCRQARFLPDLHAGYSKDRPFGNMLDNLQPGELVVFQELIDRGADPWTVVDRAVGMVQKGEAVYNLGNHEAMFLAAMVGDIIGLANWLAEGGDRMLRACGYIDELAGFDKQNPLSNIDLLTKIQTDLRENESLKKVRDFRDFLIKHGKIYMIVDGALGVHAGIPTDENGNLTPMRNKSGQVMFNGAVGIELLDAMQSALRSRNSQAITSMFSPTQIQDAHDPLWMRDSFIAIVNNPNALSNMRSQLNEQTAAKYPDGSAQVELIALGHTPYMVDTTAKSRSLQPRAIFIDGGFYQSGNQRVLNVSVPDNLPGNVVVSYGDPSGKNPQVIYQGVYNLH